MISRTPPFDRLITSRGITSTLYADDGASSPVTVTVLATNASGLRSMRESGDVTSATFPSTLATAPVPGQILLAGSLYYILAKVLRPVMTGMPWQATLEPMAFNLTGTRGDTPLTLRCLVRDDTQSMRPDGTLAEKLTLLCPLGASVQLGDTYTYNGFLYRVDATSLASADGHAYAQQLSMEVIGSADVGSPGTYPLDNATVDSTRDGSPIYTGRQVLINTLPLDRYPSLAGADALQEAAPLLFAELFDSIDPNPSAGWRAGDQVTVTAAIDGTSPGIGTRYGVYTTTPSFGPMAHTIATLVTIPAYPNDWPTPILIDRLTENDSNQGTPTDVDGTVYVYLRDLSNETLVTGQAIRFQFRLVCDGSVDIRDGDRLYGLPLVTSTRPQRIATVQHVGIHKLAGWEYKTAFVKVTE